VIATVVYWLKVGRRVGNSIQHWSYIFRIMKKIFGAQIRTSNILDGQTTLYCNGSAQRVATQQLCKDSPTRKSTWGCVFHVVRATPSAANGPMNSQSDIWHVFSVWSAPCNNRGAVFSMCGSCREDIREYGNGTWPDPGSNPGRRGGKPATNRLSCGAAL
jgi:hypothetical protein